MFLIFDSCLFFSQNLFSMVILNKVWGIIREVQHHPVLRRRSWVPSYFSVFSLGNKSQSNLPGIHWNLCFCLWSLNHSSQKHPLFYLSLKLFLSSMKHTIVQILFRWHHKASEILIVLLNRREHKSPFFHNRIVWTWHDVMTGLTLIHAFIHHFKACLCVPFGTRFISSIITFFSYS